LEHQNTLAYFEAAKKSFMANKKKLLTGYFSDRKTIFLISPLFLL